ncbi:MAG: hypothetical protein KDK90_26170 [Leptospiraceae bacterium]|nr:hypothetical protein [Leptospiraceae bacterium]
MKIRITIIFLLVFTFHCSSLQLERHDGFWDYLKGKPGLENAILVSYPPADGTLVGERHPLFLWLRTPEIFFNPQGGLYYPDAYVRDEYDNSIYNTENIYSIPDRRLQHLLLKKRNSNFNFHDTGIIDFLLQYRELKDPSGNLGSAMGHCFLSPIYLTLSLFFSGRLVTYPIHDIIKTVMLPIAIVYYAVNSTDNEEPEE